MTLVVPPSSGRASDEPTGPVGDVAEESFPPARVGGATGDDVVTAAVGRLASEYAGRVGPHLVVRVVRTCRRELGGSPVGAMPELVERLARYRLDRHIA
jgi:hypothetical protein